MKPEIPLNDCVCHTVRNCKNLFTYLSLLFAKTKPDPLYMWLKKIACEFCDLLLQFSSWSKDSKKYNVQLNLQGFWMTLKNYPWDYICNQKLKIFYLFLTSVHSTVCLRSYCAVPKGWRTDMNHSELFSSHGKRAGRVRRAVGTRGQGPIFWQIY